MTHHSATRPHRLAGLFTTATIGVAAALAVGATPADADGNGTVNTPGSTLTVRTGPSTSHTAVDQLADGTPITIECTTTNGEPVTGPYGTSTIWDRVDDDRWIADAWVYTGTDQPVAPECDDTTPPDTPPSDGGTADDVVAVAGQEFANRGDVVDGDKYILYHDGAQLDWEWCQMFVNWVYDHAGVPWDLNDGTPANETGGVFQQATERGWTSTDLSQLEPGDAVYYGTGPTPDESVHVGLVTAVHGDGQVTTIEGNVGETVATLTFDRYGVAPHTGYPIYGFVDLDAIG